MQNDETKQSLEKVLIALKSSESLLQAVVQDKTVTAEKLVVLEIKLESVEKDIMQLLHIIRGNGSEGLQIRVKLNEDHIKSLDNIHKKQKESEIDSFRGRWIMWAAVISGVAGLITSILTTLLK